MLLWRQGSLYLFKLVFLFCLEKYPEELLDHMVVLFLIFRGISILFSTVAIQICIPTNIAPGFFPPHPQQYILFVVFLIILILMGVRWYVIVVLGCNFPDYQTHCLQRFFPFYTLSFHFDNHFFCCAEAFVLNGLTCSFLFWCWFFRCDFQKIYQDPCQRDFSYIFF